MNIHNYIKTNWFDYLNCMLGGIIYALGLNIFVFPISLYIGNVTGIAQMVNGILNKIISSNLSITGILLFLINIPLLILTFKVINKGFFYKTLLTLIAQSAAMAIIPINTLPLISDKLTLSIIGGVIAGFGAGYSLRYGGSGGGLDILGVYLSLKFKSFSVGKVSMLISLVVMLYVLFNYSVEVLIYSIIFTIIYSLVLDKVHYQNVKVSALVVSENPKIGSFINSKVGRGVTMWKGIGVYSSIDKSVFMAIIDKNEFLSFKKELLDIDKSIFIVSWENVSVTGKFDKHLF